MPTLLAAPPAPALVSPFRIQEDKKQEKEKNKEKEKSQKKRWRYLQDEDKKSHHEDDDDDEGEDGGKPAVTLLTGTYDPRGASYGSLRQYTLASQGMFLDYLKGDGATKAEVIGVGMNGGSFLERRASAPVAPFLNFGWGLYHARGTSSETKLAWRVGMGITTQVGFVAKLQLLDTKLRGGELRGSSLMVGWRF
jgi:hypothetical protein